MKKNALKKMMSCLLASALVTGALAGCGSDGETKESSSTATSESVSTADTESKVESTESKVEEPTEPVKISILPAGIGEFDEKSVSGLWQAQLEEELNIEIEWVIPASGAYEEALQLTLLDDEKPDVICFSNSWMSNPSFLDALETGMFLDISDMIEDYPNLMKWTAEASWEALDLLQDGRVWGVPRSTVARADGFLLDEQWLQKLGIDYTEGDYMTLDEFFDMLYRFTYEDPDGNGIDDTYGIGAYEKDGILFTGIERIFHVGGWYEFPDGTIDSVQYSKDSDYYKQYLEFMNKCWEAGVIDPDAYALDSKTATERRKTNYGVWAEYPASMDVTLETEGDIHTDVFLPGVVVEGDPVGKYGYGTFSNGIWNFYAISADCENPEKVLELFDLMLSDEQWINLNSKNLVDVAFTVDAEGNYDWSLLTEIKAKDKENGTDLAYDKLFSYFVRRAGAPEFFINKKWTGEQQKRAAALTQITFDNYWPTLDRAYVPSIAHDQTFIEYQNYIKQEESKIITGDKPIEYWDELLDGFYKAGYEQYREEMLEYIASFE